MKGYLLDQIRNRSLHKLGYFLLTMHCLLKVGIKVHVRIFLDSEGDVIFFIIIQSPIANKDPDQHTIVAMVVVIAYLWIILEGVKGALGMWFMIQLYF
jgi:hypothetical protein